MSARRRPTSKAKTILFAAPLLVLTGVLLVVFVLRLADDPDTKVQLGDDVFEVGRAREFAPLIDRDGPLLFQDLLGGDLDVFVQHVGDDPLTAWVAIGAHAPGQPRRCFLQWQQAQGQFVDQCTKAVYPLDGTGLTRYATEVKKNKKGDLIVYVDLRTVLQTG